MEGGGGGGGDPGGDSKPTVTIVHKIKCKLGYAELHKPAPGFGPGEEVTNREGGGVIIFQYFICYNERIIQKSSTMLRIILGICEQDFALQCQT